MQLGSQLQLLRPFVGGPELYTSGAAKYHIVQCVIYIVLYSAVCP